MITSVAHLALGPRAPHCLSVLFVPNICYFSSPRSPRAPSSSLPAPSDSKAPPGPLSPLEAPQTLIPFYSDSQQTLTGGLWLLRGDLKAGYGCNAVVLSGEPTSEVWAAGSHMGRLGSRKEVWDKLSLPTLV